jgi:hypothetical protein
MCGVSGYSKFSRRRRYVTRKGGISFAQSVDFVRRESYHDE